MLAAKRLPTRQRDSSELRIAEVLAKSKGASPRLHPDEGKPRGSVQLEIDTFTVQLLKDTHLHKCLHEPCGTNRDQV